MRRGGAEKGPCGGLGLKMENCTQTFPFDRALRPSGLKPVPVPSLEVCGTLARGGQAVG